MTSMIERVALAMCNAELRRLDLPPLASVSEFRFEDDSESYMLMARAAIEEMMQPTENMIDHGVVASERQSVSTIYRAMISAALKENGE